MSIFKSAYSKIHHACIMFGLLLPVAMLGASATDVYAMPSVTIVIDPGHGGVSEENDETHSGCKYHGLEEKNVNLITAKAMYDELGKYGNVNLHMTRDTDREMTLEERVQYAQDVGADVLISIHYNASEEHNFFGSEIFTSAYGECYATGHGIAESIMKEWVSEGNIEKDIKTRIGKKGDYYGLIRNGAAVGLPVIILEHGYLDNDRDYQRIKNEDAWRRFGVLDATGVAKYFDLEKDVVKEKIGPYGSIAIPDNAVLPDSTEPTGVRLEINDYNSNKGDVEFTLYAYDDESKLMYYGFQTGDVDKDTVFAELERWDGRNGKLTGTYHVGPAYEGKLTAKVYNVYQLDTLSNTVELVPDEEAPDDEEDNALVEDEEGNAADKSAKDPSDEALTEEEDEGWMIGGDMPAVDTSAVANAIDKNTQSSVKDSYTGLLIVILIGAITIAVAVVIAISVSMEKRRKNKKDDVFEWAERYNRDK